LAHASTYRAALANGRLLAPAKSAGQMQQVIFNSYLDAALAGIFMLVVISICMFGIKTILLARATGKPSVQEAPFEVDVLSNTDALSHVK
jgi:carbon starvation protein